MTGKLIQLLAMRAVLQERLMLMLSMDMNEILTKFPDFL